MNERRSGSDGPIRLKIDLAYVGTQFHGWQIQPGLRTVQGELSAAASRLLGREVVAVGSGRTDRGVHARGQVAHLSVRTDEEAERLMRVLPDIMSPDVEISRVDRVSPRFNACSSAVSRRYGYHLLLGRDLFRPHCWRVRPDLDRAAMDRAAAEFLGAHDFTSFCKASSLKDDGNVCRIDLCAFDWQGDSAIFGVRADRFLHHMVRIMVGTLVEISLGRGEAESIPSILAARSRSQAGNMAPPEGLFLEEVRYPAHLLDPAWWDPESSDDPVDAHPEGETP